MDARRPRSVGCFNPEFQRSLRVPVKLSEGRKRRLRVPKVVEVLGQFVTSHAKIHPSNVIQDIDVQEQDAISIDVTCIILSYSTGMKGENPWWGTDLIRMITT